MNETTITTYAGNFIYQQLSGQSLAELKFFSHPEGYTEIDRNTGAITYVYQCKDHLGNIRLSYADSDKNGSIDSSTEIIEENNYYPFGLKHKGYNDVVSANANSIAQKFKYNGKELEEGLGYDMYEYEARHYDAALGRFVTIDPLAEDYNFQSTYAYAVNSPIFFIDRLGMGADWINNGDGTWTAQKGDSASTLARDAGISFERAKEIMANTYKHNSEGQNMGTYIDPKDGVEKSKVDPGDVVLIPEQVNAIVQETDALNEANSHANDKIASLNDGMSDIDKKIDSMDNLIEAKGNQIGALRGLRDMGPDVSDPIKPLVWEYAYSGLLGDLKLDSLEFEDTKSAMTNKKSSIQSSIDSTKKEINKRNEKLSSNNNGTSISCKECKNRIKQ